MERLGELAIGSPPGLRPTPAQAVIGAGRRIAGFPTRRPRARSTARSVRRAPRAGVPPRRSRRTSIARGRSCRRPERSGRPDATPRCGAARRWPTSVGARDTAATSTGARLDLGGLDSTELPIRDYDGLTASVAIRRVERLTNADDVCAIPAYATANKERKGVINSATRRSKRCGGPGSRLLNETAARRRRAGGPRPTDGA